MKTGVENRDIAPRYAQSVISGWMRFIMPSKRNKHSVHCAEFKAPSSLTRARLPDRDRGGGAPCLLRDISHWGDMGEKDDGKNTTENPKIY